MTAIAALVAEAIAKASEESVCMFRHDARETYGAPRFLTIADCEPDSVPKDNLCIAEDADSLDDADDRASSANRLNPFSGKPYTYPPRIVYVRRDVFTDALSLLASRAAEAEGRAERAEADLRRMETRALTFGAALQGIAASGDDKPTNASMFAEAVLLVEKNAGEEAPRG